MPPSVILVITPPVALIDIIYTHAPIQYCGGSKSKTSVALKDVLLAKSIVMKDLNARSTLGEAPRLNCSASLGGNIDILVKNATDDKLTTVNA
jgi:hypothetical protein